MSDAIFLCQYERLVLLVQISKKKAAKFNIEVVKLWFQGYTP